MEFVEKVATVVPASTLARLYEVDETLLGAVAYGLTTMAIHQMLTPSDDATVMDEREFVELMAKGVGVKMLSIIETEREHTEEDGSIYHIED